MLLSYPYLLSPITETNLTCTDVQNMVAIMQISSAGLQDKTTASKSKCINILNYNASAMKIWLYWKINYIAFVAA